MARRQCSKSEARSAETRGCAYDVLRVGRERRGPRGTAPPRRARRRRRWCRRSAPPRTAARAGRPSSACACRGRSARATSAGRRPPGTAAPRRAAGARAPARAAPATSAITSWSWSRKPNAPPGLVVAGAGPEPAPQVLVEEPAVHEEVEGVVGRADLHRAQRLVPAAPSPPPAPPRGGLDVAVPGDQLPDVRRVPPLAEQERRAGASPRARARRRPAARRRDRARAPNRPASASRSQRRRARQRAVAAEERGAVARSPSAARSLAWAKATRPANSWL